MEKTLIKVIIHGVKTSFILFTKTVIDNILRLNYSMAKSEAIRRCEMENRKIYVIQSSRTGWTVFSTYEAQKMVKMGIFKKNLSAKELTEKSAFVAYPKPIRYERKN